MDLFLDMLLVAMVTGILKMYSRGCAFYTKKRFWGLLSAVSLSYFILYCKLKSTHTNIFSYTHTHTLCSSNQATSPWKLKSNKEIALIT